MNNRDLRVAPANSNLSGSVSQKLTLLFCISITITPLRANIEQIQIIPHYPLTKRAKRDIIKLLGKANVRNQVLYNVAAILIANILFRFVDIKFLWIYIVAAVILSSPINKVLQKIEYERFTIKYIS